MDDRLRGSILSFSFIAPFVAFSSFAPNIILSLDFCASFHFSFTCFLSFLFFVALLFVCCHLLSCFRIELWCQQYGWFVKKVCMNVQTHTHTSTRSPRFSLSAPKKGSVLIVHRIFFRCVAERLRNRFMLLVGSYDLFHIFHSISYFFAYEFVIYTIPQHVEHNNCILFFLPVRTHTYTLKMITI